MPTINLEMMKQLLQEFSEKEALTTEEINLIEQEITTLEERVNFCRGRLQNLGADKEKLLNMKERYLNSNFQQAPRVPFSGQIDEPVSHFNAPQSSLEVNPNQSAPPPTDSPRAKIDGFDTLETSAISQQAEVMKSSHNPDQSLGDRAHSKHSENQTPADSFKDDTANKDNTEGSEHIKNINDALKGLFRSPGQNKK